MSSKQAEGVAARLSRLEKLGLLSKDVAARELALLDQTSDIVQTEVSGADLFLTGAALLPTAPVAMHEGWVASRARLAPGQCLVERYEILALLGVGGMGQVYLVFDQRRHREIAIKVLHPGDLSGAEGESVWPPEALIARLRSEIDINERLTHPKILRTYDLETSPSQRLLFLTMEYVSGENLGDVLHAAKTPLPLATSLALLQQIAEALGHAHEQGVIHLDVKPSNVLVTATQEAKLLDFGIAQPGETTLRAGVGTAYYMAPEQLRGEAVQQAADIYALGVMAFQMLTGYLPQPGMPGPSSLREGLSAAVDHAVAAAMHWRPEKRHASAPAFVGVLATALAPALARESQGLPLASPADPMASTLASTLASVSSANDLNDASHASSASAVTDVVRAASVGALAEVVDLSLAMEAKRQAPSAVARLLARIGRKRPGWFVGEGCAPKSVAPAGVQIPSSEWAFPALPSVAKDEPRQLLLSREGIPLASFVYIPPGAFVMGLEEADDDALPAEQPARGLSLEGYWIAQTPITNAAWSIFLQESGYEPSAEDKRSYYLRHWPDGLCPDALRYHPVVWVSYPVVWAFCDFYGLSLPSEAQWEKAMRGAAGHHYPWGDASPDASLCNVANQRGGVCEVGAYEAGVSPYGVFGGVGNVLEWCADGWSPRLLTKLEGEDDPIAPPQSRTGRVALRGGHYHAEGGRLRATYRQGTPLVQSTAHTGFRPVLDWRK